ncbi:hypothetical protein BWI96_10385 [Siphonobacter sp. SORGH_AS_0500]|uniref:hypothetical protein n=1 Tax=Siphonobacter sp. SORGH_AS_0500 TaxID=1864824 RepID=UPI000CAFD3DC|nr:hypothetical protein [Siphonobacter sp. SORGH_AS_0500]PKK36769.1 hypothetical protein BWI96_10385 [Siphonobacter sp. SORGH_AS_0500]
MKTFAKFGMLCLTGSIILSSCQKEDQPIITSEKDVVIHLSQEISKGGRIRNVEQQTADLKEKLLIEILELSKDEVFRQIVLEQSLKQSHGDYNVYVKDALGLYKGDATKIKTILGLNESIKSLNGGLEQIIFYPRAETIEEQTSQFKATPISLSAPVLVSKEIINKDYTSPGLRLSSARELTSNQQVTEEFAWSNDVWVVGDEENVSPQNQIPAEQLAKGGRYQGQPEYAGLIQVTDMGAIEPWVDGKFEFKIFIRNSSAGAVSERAFGSWARKNFQDQKWKDFGHFMGNWNTSTFGNWTYEKWIEEDGGASGSVTIALPPPSGQTGPTYSVTLPSHERDDDLGLATIQFTDSIDQVYNLSYCNIKRKN